jgi:sugar/nucleoside kinase (ribokinase family)
MVSAPDQGSDGHYDALVARLPPRSSFLAPPLHRRIRRVVEWVKQMFAVVGEALVDLVGQRGGQTFVAHPGGSPANVALGLARLGVSVRLTTRLGRDAFGQMVTDHLEASGVVVDAGPDPRGPTSLAIATLAAGVASYDFRIVWDVPTLPPLPIEARCLHTGSLATVLSPGDAAVLDLVRRERARGRVTVSYDPNVRRAPRCSAMPSTRDRASNASLPSRTW